MVIRYRDGDQHEVVNIDFYLCHASDQTPLLELARVAKAAHRIEECLQRSKSEAGWPIMKCAIGGLASSSDPVVDRDLVPGT